VGIDVHVLNFLLYCRKKQPYGKMVTVGRQAMAIEDWSNACIPADWERPRYGAFWEEFARTRLGAEAVESYDYSDFEHATHLADFNLPLGAHATYDTVLEGGTIEHIYNAPQALQNMAELCRVGGQVIHATPTNNFCGHGFWQFSPELFFSLYSEQNGFTQTEVFVADLANEREWFEVKRPTRSERAEIVSSTQLYAMCRTVLTERRAVRVQQSDYVHIWARHEPQQAPEPGLAAKVKSAIKRSPLRGLAMATLHVFRSRKPTSLSALNPHLTRRPVAELLRE